MLFTSVQEGSNPLLDQALTFLSAQRISETPGHEMLALSERIKAMDTHAHHLGLYTGNTFVPAQYVLKKLQKVIEVVN